MNTRRFVFLLLGALTALRLVLIGQYELFPDESYYFMWSERMDWSFFSKGPGVAAAMWLSTHLLGPTEFGIRFFSPLLALGTSLILWRFTRRIFDESVAAWVVLLVNVTPIFTAGSMVMTIDPLSLFFWAAGLYTVWRALEESPDFTAWWPATGLMIGLGFLSKYTNAMQLLSIALLLGLTPKYRPEFKRPGFYSMLAVFLVCCVPVIIWNAKHEWVTLEHLAARGGLNKPFSLDFVELLKFLVLHFGVYSPLIFGGMLIALIPAFAKAKHSFRMRFLLAFTLPLFAMYFWLSLKQAGEANWTAPAALTLGVIAVAFWHERAMHSVRSRVFSVGAMAVGMLMSLLTAETDLVRETGLWWPYDKDPSSRMRGWGSATRHIEKLRAEFEEKTNEPVFLIANEHEVAASLSYYMVDKRPAGPGHPPVYIPAQPYFEDQFSFWPRYDQLIDLEPGMQREDALYTEEQGYNPFRGHTALYISDRAEEKAPSSIKHGFESWEMIACIDQRRKGVPLRQLRVFVCRNYLDPGVK